MLNFQCTEHRREFGAVLLQRANTAEKGRDGTYVYDSCIGTAWSDPSTLWTRLKEGGRLEYGGGEQI